MADLELEQGQSVPADAKTRYAEIASGVYAQTVALGVQDSVTGAPAVLDYAHHEIHEGSTFVASYKSPDASPVADNGTVLFILTTHALYAHIEFRAACGGDAEGELYEGTTVTAGTGAALTAYNKNRSSLTISTVGVRRGMTIVGAGTLIENEFLPGGTGPLAVGGASTSRAEWILAPNTVYMVRITNRSGGAQPMSLAAEWYEEG